MENTIFGNEIEYLLSNDDFPREFTSQVQAIPYICVKKNIRWFMNIPNATTIESWWKVHIICDSFPFAHLNSSPTDRFLKRQVCYQGWFSLGCFAVAG